MRLRHMSHVVPRAVLLVAALALPASLAACGGSSSSSASSSGGGDAPQVVFIPKLLGPTYFTAAFNGAKQAAKDLGGTANQVGPSTATAAGQISFINSLTAKGTKGIAIAGNDPKALAPALRQAQGHDVKVVSYDSDVAPESRSIFVNQASGEAIGKAVLEDLAKQVDYRGQVAIVSSTPTNTNQNAWIKTMKAQLETPRYRNLQLVPIVYGEDLTDKVQATVSNLLRAYPNLKGIAAITGVALPAAASTLQSAGKGGKVALTGVATPSDMRKYVKNGVCPSFILWDVPKLGYVAYQAAAALESGKISGKQGETFTAGSAGKYTVGANGEVILGPPLRFDKSNVDKYSF